MENIYIFALISLHKMDIYNIINILQWILVIYIFIVFIISRFTIPYLKFRKSRIPDKIPKSMEETINSLKKKSQSKKEFLENAYSFLAKRYYGERRATYTKFNHVFFSLDKTWNTPGFQQCTQQNNLLRIFLVKSGFFSDDEIKSRCTLYITNIHQYLLVKLDGKWIPIDLWANFLGKKMGQHAGI